ncbi:MAG TPA: phosphatase [Gemmatimonadetes bacterium]|nr:phosphatase [Gemmatimonadota bacterium]
MKNAFFILLALLVLMSGAGPANAQQTPPADLSTILNYHEVSGNLTTAGQIDYDQIPILEEEGYEVVINLATANPEANAEEGFHVSSAGIVYIQIPVDFAAPQLSDVQMFFDVMEANKDRKLFVHCIANFRASAFVYLYRTLVEGVSDAEAKRDMEAVWDPGEQPRWAAWAELIEQAQSEFGSR